MLQRAQFGCDIGQRGFELGLQAREDFAVEAAPVGCGRSLEPGVQLDRDVLEGQVQHGSH